MAEVESSRHRLVIDIDLPQGLGVLLQRHIDAPPVIALFGVTHIEQLESEISIRLLIIETMVGATISQSAPRFIEFVDPLVVRDQHNLTVQNW